MVAASRRLNRPGIDRAHRQFEARFASAKVHVEAAINSDALAGAADPALLKASYCTDVLTRSSRFASADARRERGIVGECRFCGTQIAKITRSQALLGGDARVVSCLALAAQESPPLPALTSLSSSACVLCASRSPRATEALQRCRGFQETRGRRFSGRVVGRSFVHRRCCEVRGVSQDNMLLCLISYFVYPVLVVDFHSCFVAETRINRRGFHKEDRR